METFKSSDPWATIIIILTVALFVLALFLNGFTHDLVLEAAVFLVSAKLILMAKNNAEAANRLERHLMQIKESLATEHPQRNPT